MARTTTSNTLYDVTTNLLSEFSSRIAKRDTDALDFGMDAFLFAKSLEDKDLILRSCRALSQFYSEVKSEFPNAIGVLEEGVNYLDEDCDTENRAELYRLIGLNYDYLGELIKSKSAYDASIKELQRLGDHTSTGKLTMARSQFNLSIIYGKLGMPQQSDECLHSAYLQYKTLGDKSGIARCYISFGVSIEEKKDEDREIARNTALEYYQKAAALSLEINDDLSYCVSMGNIAVKYAEMERFDDALVAAFDALEKAKRSANKRFQLNLHRQIGRCYHLKKDFENSKKWFEACEVIFKDLGLAVDYYDLYRYWSEMLFEAGDHKEAYLKLQKSLKQQEEMHEFHKNAAVDHATLKLQLEEGRKEKALLKKKNAEIAEYTQKLEASNFELKQFAHVASHDMKEPLRTVTNYSQLLIKSFGQENLSDEQRVYMKYLGEGTNRMMDVINSMLRLSEINTVSAQTDLDLNNVFIDALNYLSDDIGKTSALISAEHLPTIHTDRVLMNQLFQNILSNSIKYNSSIPPIIEVAYRELEESHYFEIADNGIGIQHEYREKVFFIFQRLHARHEYEGNGMGLTVCKKIIDSLKGRIWIEDSHLGGTKVCFTIPKYSYATIAT
ncbi:MAG: hypothetical protein JST49_12590 [Bacteroidetes bacterium]|nr:hypothetical protein [Bacteroidota bacterium]